MSNLSEEIYNILLNNNISKEDMVLTLENIKNEIDRKLWEKINVSPLIFFKLKDTVFYNFEYCNYNNEPKGKTTLRDFGRNYPIFMLNFNTSTYIDNEYLNDLKNEIEDIKQKWNPNIYTANIYTKSEFEWIVGEENPSTLIIYENKVETPMKYGYYNNSYSNILDATGNNIKMNDNVVLCSIQQIDMYREYNSLTQMLDNLYNSINIALQYNKGLYIELDNYNYE